jgi:hypothetical protein
MRFPGTTFYYCGHDPSSEYAFNCVISLPCFCIKGKLSPPIKLVFNLLENLLKTLETHAQSTSTQILQQYHNHSMGLSTATVTHGNRWYEGR